MPRVYHRKSATGCDRCKKRRVKCDEVKPQCGACQRHRVPCHYRNVARTVTESETSTAQATTLPNSNQPHSGLSGAGALHKTNIPNQESLELALLHYFLTETVSNVHDPIYIWKTRLPLTGLKCRYVLDALLSLAALDLYRVTYADYEQVGNGALNVRNDPSSTAHSLCISNGYQHYLHGRTPWEMQHISHLYFESAIDGHRVAVEHLDRESCESAFLTALTIYRMSLYALACPLEEEGDEATIVYDFKLWYSLGSGCREIVRKWNELVGGNALRLAGYFDMVPDFSDEAALFHEKHRDLFSALLTYAKDFELNTVEESRTYEKAVSFLGLIYKCIRDKNEPATVVGSYIMSFAGKVRPPFERLVMEGRPRAIAIIGHLFAIMRLVEAQLPQFNGIASRQIPAVCAALPPAWQKAMEWPLSIAAQDPDSSDLFSPPLLLENVSPTK